MAISTTQINLSWTAATDNVGVTGYRGGAMHRLGLHQLCPSGCPEWYDVQ